MAQRRLADPAWWLFIATALLAVGTIMLVFATKRLANVSEKAGTDAHNDAIGQMSLTNKQLVVNMQQLSVLKKQLEISDPSISVHPTVSGGEIYLNIKNDGPTAATNVTIYYWQTQYIDSVIAGGGIDTDKYLPVFDLPAGDEQSFHIISEFNPHGPGARLQLEAGVSYAGFRGAVPSKIWCYQVAEGMPFDVRHGSNPSENRDHPLWEEVPFELCKSH